MRVRFVGSSVGSHLGHQYTTSFVIDDHIAVDAGSIGFISPLSVQQAIKHVFISHSHIDHIASLATFLENVYMSAPECPTIYTSDHVIDALKQDLFNERVWPDLIRLSSEETAFLKLVTTVPRTPIQLGNHTVTPIEVNHIVPTCGFIIEDDTTAISIVSDTGPTDEIWEHINDNPKMKAVFLEAAFPNSMGWLAEKSLHLTPEMFGEQVQRVKDGIPVIAVHLKVRFFDQIVAELNDLNLPNVEISKPDHEYVF